MSKNDIYKNTIYLILIFAIVFGGLIFYNSDNNFINNSPKVCYQESATIKNQNGLDNCDLDNYNGSYSNIAWVSPNNLNDGNWDTSAYTNSNGYFNIVYQKPKGSTSAIWVFRGYGGVQNVTIPSSCFDFSDVLTLRIHTDNFSPNSKWLCLNESGYQQLSITNYVIAYEEGIYWNIK